MPENLMIQFDQYCLSDQEKSYIEDIQRKTIDEKMELAENLLSNLFPDLEVSLILNSRVEPILIQSISTVENKNLYRKILGAVISEDFEVSMKNA